MRFFAFFQTLVLLGATATAYRLQYPDQDSKTGKKGLERRDGKYFHEPSGSLGLGHYDARFFKEELGYDEHRVALRNLIRAYLTVCSENKVETWLAHGTLLGWWWNGQVMPWDYDLDVQMSAATLDWLPHAHMSWQNAAGMGMNPGNGMGGGPGGGEMGAAMQGNGNGQPNATEYTLQGVMRFLQTEWHRHERDRNSWEIERQEMKGRIANLEGQARRADATQKALKRYVGILEKKVVNQQALLKGTGSVSDIDEEPAKREKDRAIRIQEKLHALHKDIDTDDEEDKGKDEPQRADLKAFLDQCQAEFAYLMVTPANPLPPRDSPPLPILEDMAGPEPCQLSDLFPMRQTEFEGLPAIVPYSFERILIEEYGERSIVATEWAGHRWVPEQKAWVRMD
ncbi:hypothetical protein BN1723_010499 [Verticillium longisporum]|uniref:Uncharacterized protein n=1 Tax=Verticillium longisporum TaxID=100787 RepID=A0A0G4KYJ7_VERLO|nr:hypothetical protein BN1723_010499 [Verticillium longisporum]